MATPLEELPLKVRRVKIVGNNRTRPYVVEDQLQVGWWRVHVHFEGPFVAHGKTGSRVVRTHRGTSAVARASARSRLAYVVWRFVHLPGSWLVERLSSGNTQGWGRPLGHFWNLQRAESHGNHTPPTTHASKYDRLHSSKRIKLAFFHSPCPQSEGVHSNRPYEHANRPGLDCCRGFCSRLV